MQGRSPLVLMTCAAMLAMAGCHNSNSVDKSAFKSAIDDYYNARQECVWPSPVKFPAQADSSNEDQTKGFDALTDAGMLTRAAAEKKRFLVGSKQVNNYDLSDKGRSTWTAEQTQPGYGNFCYGNRDVTSIDNSTLGTNGSGAKTVAVSYHYHIANVAGWANSQEMKTAYPSLASALGSNASDNATLVMTGDRWELSK